MTRAAQWKAAAQLRACIRFFIDAGNFMPAATARLTFARAPRNKPRPSNTRNLIFHLSPLREERDQKEYSRRSINIARPEAAKPPLLADARERHCTTGKECQPQYAPGAEDSVLPSFAITPLIIFNIHSI
jgi:hypothetical protein